MMPAHLQLCVGVASALHELCRTVQIPIGGEDNFQGMVDLVRMKGITWDGEVTFAAIV